jgi:hypothetical protein
MKEPCGGPDDGSRVIQGSAISQNGTERPVVWRENSVTDGQSQDTRVSAKPASTLADPGTIRRSSHAAHSYLLASDLGDRLRVIESVSFQNVMTTTSLRVQSCFGETRPRKSARWANMSEESLNQS